VATDDVKIGLNNECTNQRGAKGVGVNCSTLGGTRYHASLSVLNAALVY